MLMIYLKVNLRMLFPVIALVLFNPDKSFYYMRHTCQLNNRSVLMAHTSTLCLYLSLYYKSPECVLDIQSQFRFVCIFGIEYNAMRCIVYIEM